MDEAIVLKWFTRYPALETFIGAGTISMKMSREILGVDRYFMYDIFLELLTAKAISSSGSNSFRATKELQQFLQTRRLSNERGY